MVRGAVLAFQAMKNLLLIAVTILAVGCGEKAIVEPVADVKPVEEKNGLKDNITGKAFTIKSPDSDKMAKLIFGGDSKFSINADGIKVSEGSFIIDGLQVKVTEDVTSQADVYQFHSVKPKVGDQVSMIDGPYDKLSIVKIEPAENIIADPIATLAYKRRQLSNRAMRTLGGLRIAIAASQPELLPNWQDRIQKEMFAPPSLFLSEQHPKTEELKKLGDKVTKPWPSHFALNKNLVGGKIPTESKIVFLFESDLGWNGLGVLEDVIDYVELYKLEKVSICFSNGDYEFVDKSQLKSLKWELEEKLQEIKEKVKTEELVAETKPELGGVKMEEVERRGFPPNSLYYLKASDTPYTGKTFEMYQSGQKKSETNYKDGKKNGLERLWYENGNKEYEEKWKDGKEEGVRTWWYQSGQKKSEENLKDGMIVGLSVQWHENGKKMEEVNYKDGKIISQELWNSKGESVDSAIEVFK